MAGSFKVRMWFHLAKERQKILIVDDSEMNRSILTDILGPEYDIIEAENGLQAVATLQQKQEEISLVLLDIVMPEMDGFEVLQVMNEQRWIENVPVIMISAETRSSRVEQAYEWWTSSPGPLTHGWSTAGWSTPSCSTTSRPS